MEFLPVTGVLGAFVSGVDLAGPLTDAEVEAVDAAAADDDAHTSAPINQEN